MSATAGFPTAGIPTAGIATAGRGTPPRGLPTLSTLVDLLFALLALAIAASTFWPTYRSSAFLVMAGSAIVLGAAIAVLGARFRWPTAVVVPVSIVVLLAAGNTLAVPDETREGIIPTPAGFVDLLAGVANGWKQLVTIVTPVGSYQALLVPAYLTVFAASVVTVTIATRSTHPDLAVIPPALVLAVAIAFGPTRVDFPVLPTLVLFVLLGLWLVRHRWVRRTRAIRVLQAANGAERSRDRRFAGGRAAVAAVAVLAVAAIVGGTFATLVPARAQRTVVRSVVEQPFDPRDYPSPLTGFRSYLQPSRADDPMLSVSGLGSDGRLRVATLDTYDGVVYTVGDAAAASASGTFTRVPTTQSPQVSGGIRRSIDVVVDAYRGVWVPGAGRLEETIFGGSPSDKAALEDTYFVNDVTGTSATTRGLRAGDSYLTKVVEFPTRTVEQLSTARPGSASLPRVTRVPDELDAALQRYSGSETTAGRKLSAALAGLQSDGYVSDGLEGEPASRSGHGADRITQLLTDSPMLGDAEQYSVTAALMARRLGFPARVVMGFVAPGGASDAGRTVLTGRDVSAWIEVQTRDGWVTVDPNPPVRDIPEKQPDTPQQVSRPQSIVQPPDATDDRQAQAPQSHVNDDPQERPDAAAALIRLIATIVGWTLLGLGLLAAPFIAVVLAKGRRRVIRRRAATSIERITGGWSEFRDAAIDYGFVPPVSATRGETARAMGGTRPARLASVTDRAVFAPSAPSTEDADGVWRAVDEMRRALGLGRSRRDRVRAAVSLRSLTPSPRAEAGQGRSEARAGSGAAMPGPGNAAERAGAR